MPAFALIKHPNSNIYIDVAQESRSNSRNKKFEASALSQETFSSISQFSLNSRPQSKSVETFMDSTMTYSDFLSMEVSRQKRTIFSSETTLIEANSHLRQYVSYSPIRSNTRKTSSSSEEITNAQALTESMGSMMSARDDTTSNFGRLSLTVSTVFQLLQSLMRRSYACMEDYPQNCQTWSKLEEL